MAPCPMRSHFREEAAMANTIAETAVAPSTYKRPRKTFYKKHEESILGGLAMLLFIAIWEAFWQAGKISPLFMSGPSAIAKRFWEDLLHGSLLDDLRYSGTNFILGLI